MTFLQNAIVLRASGPRKLNRPFQIEPLGTDRTVR